MKETGVLFNTGMVTAEREDRKTQTRRLDGLKLVNENPDDHKHYAVSKVDGAYLFDTSFRVDGGELKDPIRIKCPFGVVGDRLWVREKFCYGEIVTGDSLPEEESPLYIIEQCKGQKGIIPYEYAIHNDIGIEDVRWRPSIHMPRWASRTTLEITDIRVERVSEITPADIEAGGLSGLPKYISAKVADVWKAKFEALWNSVYEKRGHGWDKNPFVWVITFKRVEVPV